MVSILLNKNIYNLRHCKIEKLWTLGATSIFDSKLRILVRNHVHKAFILQGVRMQSLTIKIYILASSGNNTFFVLTIINTIPFKY